MTIISKATGGLSLISCIRDIHKTAVIYSNNQYAKTSSDSFLSCAIGAQKANRISAKDASRKNWLLKHNFLGAIKEPFAKVGGYLKGVGMGILRYLPNFALGGVAILSKNKKLANISALGLGIMEAWDFLKNSTSIFQRTDYLK